jgi:hypothetical protein
MKNPLYCPLGLRGVQLDRARRRVAREPGALRPAQHFDRIDVEIVGSCNPCAFRFTSSWYTATDDVAFALKSFRPTPRMKKVGVVAPELTISRFGVNAAMSSIVCAP